MKPIRLVVLLIITLGIVNCHNPKPEKQLAKNKTKYVSRLIERYQQLYREGKYDSAIIVCKKGLAIALADNNRRQYIYFNLLMGSGFDGFFKKDSTIYYYQKAERLARQYQDMGYTVNAQGRLASVYYWYGMPDSVNRCKNVMIAEADTVKNNLVKMALLTNLADIYSKTNQPEKALKIYFELLNNNNNKKDSIATARIIVGIADAYKELFDYNKAAHYLITGLPFMKNSPQMTMDCYASIGVCYNNSKQYDKAVIAYQKSTELAVKMKDTAYLPGNYVLLGAALVELRQYKQAEKYLNGALIYMHNSNEDSDLINYYLSFGRMETLKGNYLKSISYYEKALLFAKKTAHVGVVPDTYNELAGAAAKAGLYQSAYQYQLNGSRLKDSLNKTNTKKNITDFEIKYQANEKEQKIALLNQASKLKDIELTDEKRKWWFLMVFVGFLSVIAFLLYRGYLQKRDSNKLLEEKNLALNLLNDKLNEANSSKTKLFSILSHDLRSPVSNLFSFLTIQKNYSNKLSPQQQVEHNDRIRHSAENLMDSMEDLLIWSKSQMNSFSLNPVQINAAEVIDYVITMHGAFAAERQLILEGDGEMDALLFTDVNFLKIVLRNVVSNAIKFTPAGGRIKIFAQRLDGSLQFSISDTGPGMTKEQIANLFEWNSIRSDSSGLGLKLAKEFTTRLGGAITVESELGGGTVFSISIPFKAIVNVENKISF